MTVDPIIPKSPNGGLDPQLRARITTASKAVADFNAQADAFINGTGARPLWESWAWTLSTELGQLLALIGETS
jgi:hypothetical protein